MTGIRSSRTAWSLIFSLIFLAGCAPQSGPRTLSAAHTAVSADRATATAAATVKPTAASTSGTPPAPAATATQPATLSPTTTPAAPITLAVPKSWQETVAAAVEQINSRSGSARWRLVEGEAADVRLVKNAQGILVRERPIVLAVPLTTPWESASREEAERILVEGDDKVRVMPWEDMGPEQKALRVEGIGPADSGYPFMETWSLAGDAALNEAMEELALQVVEDLPSAVVHFVAVGDIMLDRYLGDVLESGDIGYPFQIVADSLAAADITIGNFESALGSGGQPENKRYPFLSPPEAAAALQEAGFDVVSLANNHGMDYGEEALLEAIDLLEQSGITTVGAGAVEAEARSPQVLEVKGLTTAFLGYVNVPVEASSGFDTASWTAGADKAGLAWADPHTVTADVSAIRPEVDLVVVLLHSGIEYQEAPSEAQRAAAYAAIEAGADLVIGHHAHVLQGIEYYGDGVILYGTGNFAFEIDGPPETAVFHVWLDSEGVREIAVQPAIVQRGGQPRFANGDEAAAIRGRVYFQTELLNAE